MQLLPTVAPLPTLPQSTSAGTSQGQWLSIASKREKRASPASRASLQMKQEQQEQWRQP